LLAGTAVLILLLGYFQFYEPLTTQNRNLRQAIAQQQALYDWMQQAAHVVKTTVDNGGNQRVSRQQPLLSLLSRSAASRLPGATFNLEERTNGQVTAETGQVSFDKLVRWLAGLESEHQVRVVRARLQAGTGPGQVEAALTFE
jgi:general secretion pathway protein M